MMSAATASLVAQHLPPGTALTPRGSHQLKGLAQPEDVFELIDEQMPVDDGAPSAQPHAGEGDAVEWQSLPLPMALDRPEPTAYVGRGGDLQTVRDHWTRATSGRPLLLTVMGPAGIGKNVLVSEIARELHQQGAIVLFGRSYEENLRPYQAMAEAIRPIVQHGALDRLGGLTGEFGPLASRLLPELAQRLPPSVSGDPEGERFLLFESVVALLAAVSRQAPALLVLDDLHWADQPTLLLLCHVLRASASGPLMVLATYRDNEVDRGDPLARAMVDLHRDGLAHQLPLRGLSDREVASLIAAFSIDDAPATLTRGEPRHRRQPVLHRRGASPLRRERRTPAAGRPVAVRVPRGHRWCAGQRARGAGPAHRPPAPGRRAIAAARCGDRT